MMSRETFFHSNLYSIAMCIDWVLKRKIRIYGGRIWFPVRSGHVWAGQGFNSLGQYFQSPHWQPLPHVLIISTPTALRSVVGNTLCPWDCVFVSGREVSMKLGAVCPGIWGRSGFLCRWKGRVALSGAEVKSVPQGGKRQIWVPLKACPWNSQRFLQDWRSVLQQGVSRPVPRGQPEACYPWFPTPEISGLFYPTKVSPDTCCLLSFCLLSIVVYFLSSPFLLLFSLFVSLSFPHQ